MPSRWLAAGDLRRLVAVSPLTSETRRRLYAGGRPGKLARLLNRGQAALHAAGIWPKRLATLEVAGRRTGKRISLPVVIADSNGERYLVAMLGRNTAWVANVRAAEGHAVLRHGIREEVHLEEVAPADRAPILRRYLDVAPGARAHFPVDRRAPLSEFEAVAPSHPVFRITAVTTSVDRDEDPRPVGHRRTSLPSRIGGTAPGTWLVGRVVSPLQRRLLLATGGRVSLTGKLPVLLLTATGRRSGRPRTIPLIYVRDGDDLVVCNVRPPSERPNPWPLNVRANPDVSVRIGGVTERRTASEAREQDIERYWPRLVQTWPAYERFFAATHERAIFVLHRA
jgi:deazaflavin-dependent oxidoreductase (nitroreductase family)